MQGKAQKVLPERTEPLPKATQQLIDVIAEARQRVRVEIEHAPVAVEVKVVRTLPPKKIEKKLSNTNKEPKRPAPRVLKSIKPERVAASTNKMDAAKNEVAARAVAEPKEQKILVPNAEIKIQSEQHIVYEPPIVLPDITVPAEFDLSSSAEHLVLEARERSFEPAKAEIDALIVDEAGMKLQEYGFDTTVETIDNMAEEGIVESAAPTDFSNGLLNVLFMERMQVSDSVESLEVAPIEMPAIVEELVSIETAADTYMQLAILLSTDEKTESRGVLVTKESIRIPFEEKVGGFAELVEAEQVTIAVPASLQEVRAAAEQQPLEITLAQAAILVSELFDAPESQDLITVIKSLGQDILAMKNETLSEWVLTPEIVQKLLALLLIVGFTDPSRILYECIEQHNFEQLLQAVNYMHLLIIKKESWEFLRDPKFGTLTSLADKSTDKIGKIVMAIINRYPEGLPAAA